MKNKISLFVAVIASCIFAASCAESNTKQFATLQKENVTTTEAAIAMDANGAVDAAITPNISASKIDNRITVHKGNIETQTSNTNQYVSNLIYTINALDGHTSNYQLSTNRYPTTTQDFSTDSMYQIIEQTTKATLTMRLPVQRADSFVQQIMRMNGTILNLQLNEEDKTAGYQIADGIDEYMSDKPKQMNKYGIENTIANRVEKNEIIYKAKYFWCDIVVNGDATIIKQAALKPNAYRNPLYLNAWHAAKEGLYLLGTILVGLLYVLPMGILIFIAAYLIKKNRFRLLKK
jgi:hypothetical protein